MKEKEITNFIVYLIFIPSFQSDWWKQSSSKVFNFFENNAIVLHSISDHSKNLPTTIEVNRYLDSLKKSEIKNSGTECTLPVQIQSNDFSLTCIDFSSSVLMIISKDGGMEDLPYTIREKIEQFAKT